MKIIMLTGAHNVGKTSTIHLALLKLGNVPNIPYRRLRQVGGHAADFKTTVKYNNKSIAFFSAGDSDGILKEAITFYRNDNTDVLICACNTQYNSLINQIQNDPNNIVIPKTVSNNKSHELIDNDKDAQNIIKNI